MECRRCGSDAVVQIRVPVDGEELVFTRCGACEHNAWDGAEGEVTLDDVLERARGR